MSSVRPSVRLFVTSVDCDHIGCNSSKIISPPVSMGCSLFATQISRVYSEIWVKSGPNPVDLSIGDIRSQITAEWLQTAQRSQWRAYRKPPSLCRMIPTLTTTTSPSPKWGFHMPTRYADYYYYY